MQNQLLSRYKQGRWYKWRGWREMFKRDYFGQDKYGSAFYFVLFNAMTCRFLNWKILIRLRYGWLPVDIGVYLFFPPKITYRSLFKDEVMINWID